MTIKTLYFLLAIAFGLLAGWQVAHAHYGWATADVCMVFVYCAMIVSSDRTSKE